MTIVAVGVLGMLTVATALATVIADPDGLDPGTATPGLPPGSNGHPLGTDRLGRDLLALVLHGGRTSLALGLTSAGIAFAVGITVGVTAAVGPRSIDRALMAVVDIVITLPFLVALIASRSILEPGFWVVAVLIALFSWMTIARVARGEIRRTASQQFVAAATGSGSSSARNMWVHVIPNAIPPVLAMAAMIVATAIVAEATLSFLGLGLPPRTPSWGTVLADAHGEVLVGRWWVVVWPTLTIAVTVRGVSAASRAYSTISPSSRVLR